LQQQRHGSVFYSFLNFIVSLLHFSFSLSH
jgi:hypothetical protein